MVLYEISLDMISEEDIVEKLNKKARPDQLAGMKRFAISGDKRLGVSVPEMRKIAKEIGENHPTTTNCSNLNLVLSLKAISYCQHIWPFASSDDRSRFRYRTK